MLAQPVSSAYLAGVPSAARCQTISPGQLQVQHEADRAVHHRPHLGQERGVPGELVLVPGPDRDVGGLVALGGGVGHHPRLGPLRPRPVGPLGGAQPVVGPPGRAGQPAHRQRHRALDVIPGVGVPVRPADRAARLLPVRDVFRGGQDLGRGQHIRDFRHPGTACRSRPATVRSRHVARGARMTIARRAGQEVRRWHAPAQPRHRPGRGPCAGRNGCRALSGLPARGRLSFPRR